jgi:hypothetical protein
MVLGFLSLSFEFFYPFGLPFPRIKVEFERVDIVGISSCKRESDLESAIKFG